MLKFKSLLILSMALAGSVAHAADSVYDPNTNTWVLGNGWIQATFQLTPDGHFLTQSIYNLQSGDSWMAPANQPASPIHLQAGNDIFDASRQYSLLDQYTVFVSPSGLRQVIVLQDLANAAQITANFEIYDKQPVLRYNLGYRNMTGAPAYITWIDMVPWAFNDGAQHYTTFSVKQWSVAGLPADFETVESTLDPAGTPAAVYSGAHGQHCGWLALHDSNNRGLFAGWEFDGRAKVTVQQQASQGILQFYSTVLNLNHPVNPLDNFQTPYAFLGLFDGDFDEAGHRTQSFMESVLAKPLPDATAFPYVAWDSWAYGDAIDEDTLMSNATEAASLGVELFIVDLGWAQAIGNWYEDPVKFPHGLAALSNYVHSLGMKFGLHFALAEADPASPVLQANPDWTSSVSDGYFGASSLCLSNQDTQAWVIQQALHIIDDYQVDWILQDGENMVKVCTKTTHTHDPNDSNYANSVQGINAVVSAIQAARPNVYWENCEDGGNMMTFNMVKSYVTSITNDASGSMQSRQAVYGATYPFSPRYADRYMPASDGLSPYATHSYMFGGNWVLMFPLAGMDAGQSASLNREIVNYKATRASINGSEVFHIQPPASDATDAIMSYNPTLDSAVAVITRAGNGAPQYTLHPPGLNPSQRYTVWFEIDPSVYSMSGSQLATDGVAVSLLTPDSSEIVHIDRQQ
jgi:hypothetical protein